jgi:hypothetical protein
VLESNAIGGHVPVAPREIGANQRAKREQMKAVSRFGNVLLGVMLTLAPAIALAQQTPGAGSAPSSTEAVGPQELQNFSLNGTVTRAAEQPPPVQSVPQKRQRPATEPRTLPPERVESATSSASTPRTSATAEAAHGRTIAAPPLATSSPTRAPERLRQTAPSSSVTVALPKIASTGAASAAAEPASAPLFAPDPQSGSLSPDHKMSLLPWLLAAIALGAGGAFLFLRNRGREAFAGGPQIDNFEAPPPAPAPRPAPAPAPRAAPPQAPRTVTKSPAPSPHSTGIVSTRLRPWIDIAFQPIRCVLENDRVVVDFELELFNSGSAPARAVLVEASLFNAGPAQEQQLGAFFTNPVGEGERIVVIPPLKRISLKTQVVTARDQVQAYELAGRQVFVPLIAFNALYRWSGGDGQTSVSYLLGRNTTGEKMAPFRLDLGPRIFRGVAGRLLPSGVRQ